MPQCHVEVAAMESHDIPGVARLHYELFADEAVHRYSLATFGPAFLEDTFYKLNLKNPHFFCDVARYQGEVIGFSVYCTDKSRVFRHMVRHNLAGIADGCCRLAVRKPRAVLGMLTNMRYVWGERLPWTETVQGWWLVTGVHADYRTKEFETRLGVHVASWLFNRMEQVMHSHGCTGWYGVVRPNNPAIKKFLQKRGAALVGKGPAQGLQMEYYIKTFRAGK